ncbi:MAG: bifunctional transaldolase/phosoglucose isomerase [Cyanobacteria bacterium SZAS-4]|nr:bifunctional transaldolase/phosoglucose isomerase [Cyanobacteria bacterium SZAS-4]
MSTVKALVNPLKDLQKFGQSVWLDYIQRSLITTGELKRLIDEDGLRGITSNPSIFEKAIGSSSDYNDFIASIRDNNLDAAGIYEKLAIRDIQDAADILLPVYTETNKRDGYVSLEVSPLIANDTKATLAEAKKLWKEVARPNVMIKVPATEAGIPAIRELISDGININVTLLFSEQTYERVADAYIAGLESLASKGGDISSVASVASFFISRIDTDIDTIVSARLAQTKDDTQKQLLNSVLGQVAVANAKLTYERYTQIFSGSRWEKLKGKGAHTQRVLWASTSTKNPNYPDTMYIDELIGQDTVNTIPPATFEAFRKHGKPQQTLTENLEDARQVMDNLEKLNISMKDVTDNLVVQGVKLFADAFHKLTDTVARQRSELKAAKDQFSYRLPEDQTRALHATLKEWKEGDKVKKLWKRDASLWTNEDEALWLDWLPITEEIRKDLDSIKAFAAEIKSAGFTHAVLLGMGGSSLCPEVMSKTFGHIAGFPDLKILDSTDPEQIATLEKSIDIAKTLFIVSSKSGSTLEPNIYKQYFFKKVADLVGKDKAGKQFIAITDPGSKMQGVAEKDKFRKIFFGVQGIGGRYSALSNFGMVPSAVIGVDLQKFLDRTDEMVRACSPETAVEENPGVVLGTMIGLLAKAGRDKLTLIASPGINDIGAWLEQLLAESTGKVGKGIVPVDREPIGLPAVYGKDRFFAYLRLDNAPDAEQDRAVEALEKAGQPVVRINVPDIYCIGQEFFRWEIATAVAGSIIGINAFNQPDVEASKIATKEITEAYEKKGALPEEKPFYEGEGVKLFSDDRNVNELNAAIGANAKTLAGYLKAHTSRVKAGDYFAILAYIEMNDKHEQQLQNVRVAVRDFKKVATCLGFGPRFQHSTGQAYKGGPNTGVFLQVTCDHKNDLEVPGQKYTFGVVEAAQCRGDGQVLAERGRRMLRVHLTDVEQGLATLEAAAKQSQQK